MAEAPGFLRADWSLNDKVVAMTTQRAGGVSEPPFDSLNLGLHTGDKPEPVNTNRQRVYSALQLTATPVWLRQTHGTRVFVAKAANYAPGSATNTEDTFDAAYSTERGQVLAVLTADCLPVVFASASGEEVAIAHAGWRGLADGVLQNTLACFSSPANEVHAWLGPGIGPGKFAVGEDVRDYYFERLSQIKALEQAFVKIAAVEKWHANLYLLARLVLRESGLTELSGGGECTFSQPENYFSYRRDGVNSGRMATFVWRR